MRRFAVISSVLLLSWMGACKSKDGAPSDAGKGAQDDGAGKGELTKRADDQDAGDEDLPDAESVLDRAVEAVGGRAKLDAIESFYYAGEISLLGQNIGGEIEIWWKNGDFYTEQQMVGIGNIRAGKAGDTIWSDDPINGLRKLDGAEAEQHTWASSLMLAADWKRYFESAKLDGKRELDGKVVYDVRLESASGAEVLLSFDARSGLQLAQKYEQVTPMGKVPVSVDMQDYREVEGVKVAFKQVTDASLAKATQTITKIEINPSIDTARFAMPSSEHEVVKEDTMMPFDADGKPGKPVPTSP